MNSLYESSPNSPVSPQLTRSYPVTRFNCFISTIVEVSEWRKAGMSQRPLSGATFVLIKEKHANAVKQNQRTRKKISFHHIK